MGINIELTNFGKYAQEMRQHSFLYSAPRLFNRLPRYIRDDNSSNLLEWKGILDEFLSISLVNRCPDCVNHSQPNLQILFISGYLSLDCAIGETNAICPTKSILGTRIMEAERGRYSDRFYVNGMSCLFYYL